MANIKCPKCKSTNIEIMGQRKKNFSIGKALVGTALTMGTVGAMAGFIGKKGKYDVFCKDCGNRFKVK